jgi:hypothetical protein
MAPPLVLTAEAATGLRLFGEAVAEVAASRADRDAATIRRGAR